jgi:hypothetical protein
MSATGMAVGCRSRLWAPRVVLTGVLLPAGLNTVITVPGDAG